MPRSAGSSPAAPLLDAGATARRLDARVSTRLYVDLAGRFVRSAQGDGLDLAIDGIAP